jgi:hypothetical protein
MPITTAQISRSKLAGMLIDMANDENPVEACAIPPGDGTAPTYEREPPAP